MYAGVEGCVVMRGAEEVNERFFGGGGRGRIGA